MDITGLGTGMSEYPFALSLEQSKTERLLANHLERQNKFVQWNCTFTHFNQNENQVNIFYTGYDGVEHEIIAEYLVGCDGAASPVRHQMGLNFEGDTIPKIFYVADVRLSSPVINRNELFGFLIPKGFILFFPMEGEGHYRIIGILPEARDTDFTFDDIIPSIKNELKVPINFVETFWFSSYKVHSRMAGSFKNGRSFIAGDAGHIHTPAGGQGMNTGIQDSYNLAWKLALCIRGDINEKFLETYNTERVANAANLLRTTDKMFDILTGMTGFWNFIRLHMFPLLASFVTKSTFVRKNFFPLISQTGIAYPDSILTIESSIGNIRAGNRMPYFVFSSGKNIYDYLHETGFSVLYFGTVTINFPGVTLPVTLHSFDEIPKLFGKEKDFYILLRPDNHISFIGKDVDKIIYFMNSLQKA